MLKKSFLLSVLAATAVLPLSADVVLVDNGTAKSSIVFDAKDKRIGKYAQILADYIKTSSGAELSLNKSDKTNTVWGYFSRKRAIFSQTLSPSGISAISSF